MIIFFLFCDNCSPVFHCKPESHWKHYLLHTTTQEGPQLVPQKAQGWPGCTFGNSLSTCFPPEQWVTAPTALWTPDEWSSWQSRRGSKISTGEWINKQQANPGSCYHTLPLPFQLLQRQEGWRAFHPFLTAKKLLPTWDVSTTACVKIDGRAFPHHHTKEHQCPYLEDTVGTWRDKCCTSNHMNHTLRLGTSGYFQQFSKSLSSAAEMDFTEVNFLCPFGCSDVDTSHWPNWKSRNKNEERK